MSGIAGIIRFDGAPVGPGDIERMTSAMAHRGPDGIGHRARGHVALGQCMLRTTPESLEEIQPLTNENDDVVLVMDGRVDNWAELRRELLGCGAKLRSRSDAELVLRAYEHWGRECLQHIEGDFALAIWDYARREAFCARDRVGNKPLNYWWTGTTLVFASDVAAILSLPWVSEVLNEGVLVEFLADEWHSREETFWQGIRRLVAAHCMQASARSLQISQYWEPNPHAVPPCASEGEYIEHYRALLADVVRRHSRSHAPVAFEVSGGLDSSAVFCMADHLLRAGRLSAPAIDGYVLAFPDDEAANELEYSRAVAAQLGVPVREIPPSLAPLSWYRTRAAQEREFPGYPNGAMSLALREQARADGARAILSGLGGDEWLGDFWGTRAYYLEELTAGRWRTWLDWVQADFRELGPGKALRLMARKGLLGALPTTLQESLLRTWRSLRAGGRKSPPWLSDDLQRLLDDRRQAVRQPARTVRDAAQAARLRSLRDDYTAWAVESEERMCARIGLELRHPLRSPALIEFSFGLPARLLVRGRTNKYLHLRAMEGLLPEKIATRTSKAEFSVVSNHQLNGIGDELTRIALRHHNWLQPGQPTKLYAAYESGKMPSSVGRGKAQWLLSGLLGCDALTESGAGRGEHGSNTF